MTVRKNQSVAKIFAAFMPEQRAAAYEKLWKAGGVPLSEAAEFLGGQDVMDDLAEAGMADVCPATPDSPPTFQPARLDLALQGVLAGLLAQLVKDSKLLSDGYRELTAVLACMSQEFSGPRHLVEVTTDPHEVLRWSRHLINSARQDWMTLESFNTDMPVTDEYLIKGPAPVRENVHIRSIYDRAFTESPVGARFIEDRIAAGEEARIMPEVPVKMQIADESAVLLPLVPTGTRGAMMVHAHPVVHEHRVFFDMLWDQALPYGRPAQAPGCPLTQRQLKALALMVQGQPDSNIAKQLGCSEKTVGREINVIMEKVGTRSRCTVGYAAARKEWVK